MEIYGWIFSIIFLASFLHGLAGFGFVLLALPALAMFLDIKVVIPLVILVGCSINLILLIQLWHHFEKEKIYPLIIGALPGIAIGAFVLKIVNENIIRLVLGAVLIFYAIFGLFVRFSNKNLKDGWAYLYGFLAGCFGGAIGAIGPPIVVYASLQSWNKDKIKAMLQGFLFLSGILIVVFQALIGITTVTVLVYYGISLPIIVVGVYLGTILYGRIEEALYKRIILTVIGLMGIFMIYKAAEQVFSILQAV